MPGSSDTDSTQEAEAPFVAIEVVLEAVPAETPHTRNELPSDNALLAAQVAFGIGRDSAWGYLSYLDKSWLIQLLGGGIGLVTVFIGLMIFCPSFRNRKGAIAAATFALASEVAIYPWNYGQDWGIAIGQNMGMSTTNAGYYAGFYTGATEIATQAPMIAVSSAINDQRGRMPWLERFRNLDPTGGRLGKALGIVNGIFQTLTDLVLGIIPGAAWQWVFNAFTTLLPSVATSAGLTLLGSIAIAAAVAIATVLVAKLASPLALKLVNTLFEKAAAFCCSEKPTPALESIRVEAAAESSAAYGTFLPSDVAAPATLEENVAASCCCC